MKKLTFIAGLAVVTMLAAGTAHSRTMTDAEFFANINDLAYDDQQLETVEFARMELVPVSSVSTTSSQDNWIRIIHDPLYSEAD